MGRNLKERKKTILEIDRIEKILEREYKQHTDISQMDDVTKSLVMNLETQLAQLRVSQQSRTVEYAKLTEKHQQLIKDLKGTRDQRIANIESSKETFISLIKALEEEEYKDETNKYMELTRLSAKKEFEKLSNYHKYIDGEIDQPILTANNLIDEKL